MRQRDRFAAAALVAGAASLGAAAGGRYALRAQASVARKIVGKPLGEIAPEADKVYKKRYGMPINLLILGDSIAAGLGAEFPRDTPGARLSRKVAKRTHRAVRLRTAAVVGSDSDALEAQLQSLPDSYRPDVAVVIIGGNDVMHRVAISESVGHLERCILGLQERGAAVVVGTCPDLGTLRFVPQPLRTFASRSSRQLAEAQRVAALRAGARVVSLARVVGPFFVANPEEMFSLDHFHPSSIGYKRTAAAILPSVLASLGVVDEVPFGHHVPVG